ncbi:MAG: hypothetical protein KF849_10930 [Rhizobiaceae bacterium]|nr:hypothetical protein [Rhizobiaceae bacterium]
MRPALLPLAFMAALFPAVASAQVGYLAFGSQPADMHARAVELLSSEAGNPVSADQVIISAVDLSGDGQLEMIAYARNPAFCDDQGCEPRIFMFDGTAWINLLEPGLVRTRAVPGAFSIVNVSQTGFSDILVGSLLLVFDGRQYVEERPPEPTDLDTAAFDAACRGGSRTATLLAEASIPDRGGELCACLAGLFEQMGHPQEDLDAATAAYSGSGEISDDPDLSAILADYELSCRIELTAD